MTDDWQSCGDISKARAAARAEQDAQAKQHITTTIPQPDVPADTKEK